ncbi:hypothetical protein LguiB_025569 [Lonicera macranthoides]
MFFCFVQFDNSKCFVQSIIFFRELKEKTLDLLERIESDLNVELCNFEKLKQEGLWLKNKKEEAQEVVRSFQGALELRTKEKEELQARFDKLESNFLAERKARKLTEQNKKSSDKELK